MSLPRFSVRHPVTTLMCMSVVVLLGAVSLSQLPMDLLPKLEQPVLVISTPYSGAGPEEVASMVTIPIERSLGTAAGLSRMTSQSSEGWSQVVLEFAWGTDMRESRDTVKDRLARMRFADGVGSPTISRYDPSTQSIMSLSVTGPEDLAELRSQALERVLPLVEGVDGVGSVTLSGGRTREIVVLVDQAKLRQYNLTLSQVQSVIAANNLAQPADAVRDADGQWLGVRVMGKLGSIEDLRNLVLTYIQVQPPAPKPQLKPVYLHDVAQVTDELSPITTIVRTNGKTGVTMAIFKESDANTVRVSRAVAKALAAVDGGLEVTVVTSQAQFIEAALGAVRANLLTGGLLALAVLAIVLRALGNVAIISISIPFSIITAFALMYFTDLTLNVMTIGGLALGVGMLVDNSIVVIENIHRFLEAGHPPDTAAIAASNEVAGAITASTLTTVAVFLPVVYVGGMTGDLFKELALTVACSLLASLAVALTVVPMLASRWLKPKAKPQAAARPVYPHLLTAALRRPFLVILIAAAFGAASFSLLPRLGREFLPNVDEPTVSITLTMPEGTELSAASAKVAELEALIFEIPEVRVFTSNITATRGRITARLHAARARTPQQLVQELGPKAGALAPPGTVTVSTQGSVFGLATGSSRTLQLTLSGPNQTALEAVLDKVVAAVGEVDGLHSVTTSLDRRRPELHVVVNQEAASRHGLTSAQVAGAVRTALAGTTATQFETTTGRTIAVRVRLRPEDRESVNALSSLLIRGSSGMIELKEVADLVQGAGPRSLSRLNQRSTVTITAAIEGRDLGSASAAARVAVAGLELPASYRIETQGSARLMQEGFQGLSLALALAVALVYMIMAAQFESLLHPLVIMVSLPLASTGALAALYLGKRPLGVTGMIGLIMLAGIVVNNAIVLVDYTNKLRRQGLGTREALAQAAPARLRPIMMTAVTTILALVPLALGRGEASEIQQPLALAVVGGLVTSTLLTLIVIPCCYLLVTRDRKAQENASAAVNSTASCQ